MLILEKNKHEIQPHILFLLSLAFLFFFPARDVSTCLVTFMYYKFLYDCEREIELTFSHN
jgi:hypothetical protein